VVSAGGERSVVTDEPPSTTCRIAYDFADRFINTTIPDLRLAKTSSDTNTLDLPLRTASDRRLGRRGNTLLPRPGTHICGITRAQLDMGSRPECRQGRPDVRGSAIRSRDMAHHASLRYRQIFAHSHNPRIHPAISHHPANGWGERIWWSSLIPAGSSRTISYGSECNVCRAMEGAQRTSKPVIVLWTKDFCIEWEQLGFAAVARIYRRTEVPRCLQIWSAGWRRLEATQVASGQCSEWRSILSVMRSL
jgi:hypothetical protein